MFLNIYTFGFQQLAARIEANKRTVSIFKRSIDKRINVNRAKRRPIIYRNKCLKCETAVEEFLMFQNTVGEWPIIN